MGPMHTWSAHTGWSVVGLGVFDCDVRCHPSIPPFGARARDGPEVEFMSRVLVGVRLCSPLRLPSPSCNFLITSHRCSAALPTENCIARKLFSQRGAGGDGGARCLAAGHPARHELRGRGVRCKCCPFVLAFVVSLSLPPPRPKALSRRSHTHRHTGPAIVHPGSPPSTTSPVKLTGGVSLRLSSRHWCEH